MLSSATVLLAGLGAPVAMPPPTFAPDFYMGEELSLVLNQGGYDAGGQACCPITAPDCKIQAINSGSDVWEQRSKNRTLVVSPSGTTMHDFNIKKVLALVPGSSANSTHKWACAAYCRPRTTFRLTWA
jgi:hypothetical protein